MWVGGDVIRIVVVDEIVAQRGEVNGEGRHCKQEAMEGRRAESLVPGGRVPSGGFRQAMRFVVFCH
jgi:hypothetical protein